MLSNILVIFFVCFVYWLHKKFYRRLYLASKFEGPKAFPLIGNALMFFKKSPAEYAIIMSEASKIYGLLNRFWMANKLFLIVLDPEQIKTILTSKKLTNKADQYRYLKPYTGDGLIASNGAIWASHNKIITPAFHHNMLSSYLRVFDKETNYFIEKMENYVNGEAFDFYPPIALMTLDVISTTCMGLSLNFQSGNNLEFSNASKGIHRILSQRMFDVLLGNDFLFQFTRTSAELKKHLKVVHEFCDKVIVDRRELILATEPTNKVLIDFLLEAKIDGQSLTNKDIRDEVLTFMTAGHGTSAITISFALYNIGRNPEVQRKVVEEIKNVIGDGDVPSTVNVLNDLRYMDMVIKESLRLFPAIPQFGRKVVEEFELDGKIVPVDTTLVLSPFTMGKRPELFDEPEKFIPERFAEGEKQFHNFAYLPFSSGQRHCPGFRFATLEIKSFLSKFLRRYEVAVEKNFVPQLVIANTIQSANGVMLKLSYRAD